MFEICVISPARRSSLLKHDSILEARQTAREAAAITGCKVEIVDRRTGDVVEWHEPPTTPKTDCDDGRSRTKGGTRTRASQESRAR
jgi:hypothetical protein